MCTKNTDFKMLLPSEILKTMTIIDELHKIRNTFTWPNVLPCDANIVIPIMSGLHVEEADDVEPFVDDDGGEETALAWCVYCEVQCMDAHGRPVANVGVAAVRPALQ